ncbi:hypothetical protein SDC9_162116 [bioreactor metagenome]|uniref:Uncharacterized protein n=1 Tax=bioreactor metagenome TaxID=1076179 RepID=A0A645FK51_9ZZZZ
MNCHINPRIKPPIKFGIKNIVLSKLLIFDSLVTRSANKNPITFITITDATVNLVVNMNEFLNDSSEKAFM